MSVTVMVVAMMYFVMVFVLLLQKAQKNYWRKLETTSPVRRAVAGGHKYSVADRPLTTAFQT